MSKQVLISSETINDVFKRQNAVIIIECDFLPVVHAVIGCSCAAIKL